jgi:DNA-binding GntR family transcriptional regulator
VRKAFALAGLKRNGSPSAARGAGLPLAEVVYQALRRELISGTYRPGDRLREEEVAQRLRVSRTPVREALGRLVAKGLVVSSGGRGLVVRALETSQVVELYAMREILEGGAARLAAQYASMPEIDALNDLDARYAGHASDPHALASDNRMIHKAVFAAARNRYLDGALQELQDAIALLGGTTFSVPGRPKEAAGEHRAIIDAIARRDGDAAEEAARAHIREALRARLKMPRLEYDLADLGRPKPTRPKRGLPG